MASAQDARGVFDRAVRDFFDGRIAESAAGFDRVAKMAPNSAAHLWQRGIALYYAGRYGECRAQFESHRTVNPDDVENAAWHYLCVARAESPGKARAALLPVGPDSRVPMSEIYRVFKGEMMVGQMVAAAGSREDGLFYAHLYAGLYYEVSGDKARAMEHLRIASEERFSAMGYMHGVAKVHLKVRGAEVR